MDEDEDELIVPDSPLCFDESDDENSNGNDETGKEDDDVQIIECKESIPEERTMIVQPENRLIDPRALFDNLMAQQIRSLMNNENDMSVNTVPVLKNGCNLLQNNKTSTTGKPFVTITPVPLPDVRPPQEPNSKIIAPHSLSPPDYLRSLLVQALEKPTKRIAPKFVRNVMLGPAKSTQTVPIAPNLRTQSIVSGIVSKRSLAQPPIVMPSPSTVQTSASSTALLRKFRLVNPNSVLCSNQPSTSKTLPPSIKFEFNLNKMILSNVNSNNNRQGVSRPTSSATSSHCHVDFKKPLQRALSSIQQKLGKTRDRTNVRKVCDNHVCDKKDKQASVPVAPPVIIPPPPKPRFPCECGKVFKYLILLEDHIKKNHVKDVRVNLNHISANLIDEAENGDSRFVDVAVQKMDLKLLLSLNHALKPKQKKENSDAKMDSVLEPVEIGGWDENQWSLVTIQTAFDTTFMPGVRDFTIHTNCIQENIIAIYLGEDPSSIKLNIECHYCGIVYTRLKTLRKHAMDVHKFSLDYAYGKSYCAVCDEIFPYSDRFRAHLKQTHSKAKKKFDPSNAKFVCELCEEFFTNVDALDSHRNEKHEDAFPLLCVLCGVSFQLDYELENHCLQHSYDQIFRCNICGEMFAECETFKNHVNGHSKTRKNANCSACEQLFKTETDMKDHIETMRRADLKHYLLPH